MPSDHAPQPGLVHPGPVVGWCEFDVRRGADISRLRRSLGRAVADGAVVGVSSSLLGTLDPAAMPGGFRPLGRHQPDLLLWVNGGDETACATADGSLEAELADVAARRRGLVGPLRARSAPGPVPAIAHGPGAGGTYLVVVGPADPPVPHLTLVSAGGPTHLVLARDLDLLEHGEAAGAGGGLYLAPDVGTLDRLTAP